MLGPLCQRVAAACGSVVDGLAAGATRTLLEEVQAGLAEPLRVAVTGRVNAGKSTLVNALLRQCVAPTDVSECTRLVTWFRYGVPERVVVVGADGGRRSLPLRDDGTLPLTLGVDIDDVERLEVFVSNEALTDLVLIDTPGLASLDEARSRATRELLAIDASSRDAVARADAVIFVMTSELRRDEVEVIDAFHAVFHGLGASALNAVGVLNKADQLGDGTSDPRIAAGELARRSGDRLQHAVAGVVPMIGLLAETADAGRFTEQDAATLRALAALPEPQRRVLLLSTDRFVTGNAPVSEEARARLLERLDRYGIERALDWVTTAERTASDLAGELRVLSGIERLRRMLNETFATNADALKAAWAVATLERVAFTEHADTDAAQRRALRNEIEAIRLDPRMHRLAEIRALQEWAARTVELPPDAGQRLHRLFTGDQPAARLGLDPDAALDDVRDAAATEATRWKTFGNEGRATPRQRWLADVAVRTCEQLWADAAVVR